MKNSAPYPGHAVFQRRFYHKEGFKRKSFLLFIIYDRRLHRVCIFLYGVKYTLRKILGRHTRFHLFLTQTNGISSVRLFQIRIDKPEYRIIEPARRNHFAHLVRLAVT